MDWRRVEVGVIGDKNDITISRGVFDFADAGAGTEYVRFVVEASKVAPMYWQNETLKLRNVSLGSSAKIAILRTQTVLQVSKSHGVCLAMDTHRHFGAQLQEYRSQSVW